MSGRSLPLPGPLESDPGGRQPRPAPFRVGWFAGANLRILNLVRSEWTFYNSLGALVLVLTCVSGYTMALAAAYAFKTQVGSVWFIGVGWTIVLINIERAVLQVPMIDGRPARWPLTGRIVLSIVLGFVLSLMLVLRIDQGEIDKQLGAQRIAAIERSNGKIENYFDTRIETEITKRQAIRHKVANLQNRAGKYREHSLEVEPVCGQRCRILGHRAETIGNKLREVGPTHRNQLAGIHAHLDHLRGRQEELEGTGEAAIGRGGGLLDRLGALATLSENRTSTLFQVLFLHLLFLCLDLTPLGFKLSRLKTGSAYEEQLALEVRRDRFAAKTGLTDLELGEYAQQEQARADKEVIRTEIMYDTDQRMNEAGMGSTPRPGDVHSYDDPIEARSLANFADEWERHEDEFIPVPPALTRAGVIGASLIGGLALLATLWTTFTHHAVTGIWLAVIAFLAAAALAAYTHGFRSAPMWALRPIFWTLIVGIVLPPIVLALNV